MLPTLLQQYVHLSRYSRWIEAEQRRETYNETVERYVQYFSKRHPDVFPAAEIRQAITSLNVMPSMRAFMTAGPALDHCNVAGYNCSAIAIDSPESFDEILYVLMCGTGVGFSVEEKFINLLPYVPSTFRMGTDSIVVEDSKQGWAEAFRRLLYLLYNGVEPASIDYSKVRPAGARLKTFGGRASGPEPLQRLFDFAIRLFKSAAGRKLTAIECHDLACMIADIVVVGGVRRSALISLSSLEDPIMRDCKSGEWWTHSPHRALANNSAVYHYRPTREVFDAEWDALVASGSGERGVFSRYAAQAQAVRNGRRKSDDFLTNPCAEILLRSAEFCNLTEVVVRAADTKQEILEKVRLASILGTFQSALTSFRHLRPKWLRNSKEERLLGVSLTGIMDHPLMAGLLGDEELAEFLREARALAVETNRVWAKKLGIEQSAAVTTVKPSGTVSQMVDSASGIHPRYSQYYIRTVRGDNKDPLTQYMKLVGIPNEPCVMKPNDITVFSFPVASPANAVLRNHAGALRQLELYRLYRDYWCEHNVSITVYVKQDEWQAVGDWVYANFNYIGGVSFLPHSDHTYQQAPYQEVTKEQYDELAASMPDVDWAGLQTYEREDGTGAVKEYACTGGSCEII